ncbi:MAG: hypothetical protein K1Y36_22255 [Blastocatellia bacterium]|nr:hypothetical protein [Blastocatellia bacterium]
MQGNRATVRFSETTCAGIERLLQDGKFGSENGLIQQAVEEFIARIEKKTEEKTEGSLPFQDGNQEIQIALGKMEKVMDAQHRELGKKLLKLSDLLNQTQDGLKKVESLPHTIHDMVQGFSSLNNQNLAEMERRIGKIVADGMKAVEEPQQAELIEVRQIEGSLLQAIDVKAATVGQTIQHEFKEMLRQNFLAHLGRVGILFLASALTVGIIFWLSRHSLTRLEAEKTELTWEVKNLKGRIQDLQSREAELHKSNGELLTVNTQCNAQLQKVRKQITEKQTELNDLQIDSQRDQLVLRMDPNQRIWVAIQGPNSLSQDQQDGGWFALARLTGETR